MGVDSDEEEEIIDWAMVVGTRVRRTGRIEPTRNVFMTIMAMSFARSVHPTNHAKEEASMKNRKPLSPPTT
jgi:hypothetical protein